MVLGVARQQHLPWAGILCSMQRVVIGASAWIAAQHDETLLSGANNAALDAIMSILN
jgi:hypothetical protein